MSPNERGSRGTDRRSEILERAAALFADAGVANASLADIADAVGIKKGSLYYFFESKEKLLHEVLLPVVEQPYLELREIAHGPGTPVEKIVEGMAALGRAFSEHPERMEILIRERLERHLPDEAYRQIMQWKAAYTEVWKELLRGAVASGELSDLDEKIVTFGLIGAMNWMYAWFDPHGERSGEEIGRLLATHLLTGLLPDEATAVRDEVRREQARLREATAPALAPRRGGRRARTASTRPTGVRR